MSVVNTGVVAVDDGEGDGSGGQEALRGGMDCAVVKLLNQAGVSCAHGTKSSGFFRLVLITCFE